MEIYGSKYLTHGEAYSFFLVIGTLDINTARSNHASRLDDSCILVESSFACEYVANFSVHCVARQIMKAVK